MSVLAKRILAVVAGGGLALTLLLWQIAHIELPATIDDPAARSRVPDDGGSDAGGARALPEPGPAAPEAAALGEVLFHDPRLSADGSLSCASCHDVSAGGDDGQPRSPAIAGTRTAFNASSVLNSRFNLLRFWQGEDESFGAASSTLPHGAAEMGSSPMLMVLRVEDDPGLARRFRARYADGVSPRSLRHALTAYLDSLAYRDSRFDRYLRGERTALDYTERQGYRLFRELGCSSCHQGRNLGGNMTQPLGIFEDAFDDRDDDDPADLGRYALTGREEDRHVFRVPSLRNVAETAPYFHDGSIPRLETAVRTMARLQLGRLLDGSETDRLVAFLRTLTAEPAEVLR